MVKKLTCSSREIQIFLIGFIVIEICEIFTVGGFPLDPKIRKVCQPFYTLMCHLLTYLRDLRRPISVQSLPQPGSCFLMQSLASSCSRMARPSQLDYSSLPDLSFSLER